MRARISTLLVLCAVAAGSPLGVAAQGQTASNALAARIQTLEDREAIRALLVAYATTLDNRDFAGFEQLWADATEMAVRIRPESCRKAFWRNAPAE